MNLYDLRANGIWVSTRLNVISITIKDLRCQPIIRTMGGQTRREFLSFVSGGTIVGIAGCSESAKEQTRSPSEDISPTATTIPKTESPTTPVSPTATTVPTTEPPTETSDASPTETPPDLPDNIPKGPPLTQISVTRDNHDQSVIYFDVSLGVPNNVDTFILYLYYFTVKSSKGFNKTEDSEEYRWDGVTASPSLSLAVDTDNIRRTVYENTYASTDSWAFGPTPYIQIWWSPNGEDWESFRPLIDRTYERVSVFKPIPGVIGGGFFYLGSFSDYSFNNNGQVIRLIVPDQAALTETPSKILQAISGASKYLVGKPHKTVLCFTPPDPIRGGGLSKPEAGEFWVHADTQLKTPETTWFHEYIHLRQQYTLSKNMTWFGEGSADYYATLLAYAQDLISQQTALEHFAQSEYKSAVLSRPSTWSSKRVPYSKGESVLSVLDIKIRDSSENEYWLGNVSYQLNQLDDKISYGDFKSIVVDVAGGGISDWLDEYITTSAWPDNFEDDGQ